MSKFNTVATRPATGQGPIRTEATPSATTHEGAPGYLRDVKSELFLLAVANFVGEDTFYEKAGDRDDRYAQLVREVAVSDVEWLTGFVRWLRAEGNMRSAPLVAAAEAIKARLDAGAHGGNRSLVSAAMARADEPGEFVAYWRSRFGRALPLPVKNGLADAVRQLYTERSLLKYDTDSKGYRFADIIDTVRPEPVNAAQSALFEHALARRHGREELFVNSARDLLPMLATRAHLNAMPAGNRRLILRDSPDLLRQAGMTWEALSAWLPGGMDAAAWTAIIPSMGYMALLRNLRNFDQAGVPDEVAEQVAARLADPNQVARSRQFPFRFYAAHNAVQSLRWGHALEKALNASLSNVPALPGRTLVLVDQSPSMFPGYGFSSKPVRSDMSNADVAKLFGSALALRAADGSLVGYGHANYRVPFSRGEAVLRLMGKFHPEDGTDAYTAARDHFDRHDRIVVVTDGENNGRLKSWAQAGIPASLPIYTWNIGGYQYSQDPGGLNRLTFGGMTDAAFRMVPLIEAGRNATWPWLQKPAA